MLRAALRKGYIWVCAQDYRPGHENCGYFEWAKFDEFGEPPWSVEFVPGTQEEEVGDCEMLEVNGVEDQEDEEEEGDEEETENLQEALQEHEQREWSDETVEGSERDLGEDWGDGDEDAEIAEELQEWRNGLQ